MLADPPNDQVHIKKFNHPEPFLFRHFAPFEAEHPEYQALLFTYDNDRYKSLLVPTDMTTVLDDECPRAFDPVSLKDSFAVTGNDGFQYQAMEKTDPGNTRFHFGMTRIYAHKPFSDYNIMIKLDQQTWTYRAQASDFSRYILDDADSLESMHAVLVDSPFVLTAADHCLQYLFSEKDAYENFSQLINLFSMILGPSIIQFQAFDERDFYVQAEHTYVSCLNCSVTCYDQPTPTIIQGGGVISGFDCKIIKLPPADDEDGDPPPPPPPPPPVAIDPLTYMIQDYPSKTINQPPVDPPTQTEVNPVPVDPPDDALHTSLWLPCQEDVDLYYGGANETQGSKGDFSTFCVDPNPSDDVEHFFYRITEDNIGCASTTGCKHEMFEVTSDGIYIRREIMNDSFTCSDGSHYDYRHNNKYKWFPRFAYPPMLFVEWHDEWCLNKGGSSDLGSCGSLQTVNDAVPKVQNYAEVADDLKYPTENGNIIEVYEGFLDIPSPNDSRSATYCTGLPGDWPQSPKPSCPSGQLLLANENDLVEYTCYSGPTLGVKILKQIFYLSGGGTDNMDCGKESYYYAVDEGNPAITWGYVFYEYNPPASSCTQEDANGNSLYIGCPPDCYKNEYFSTKYYPDLQPHIPNSAQEKH